MIIKPNYSPNFSKENRLDKDIKFVIIHYTGMQSEIESIKRLKNPKFKVSCHFLINRKGRITQMVEEKKIAWHAGKSKWKKLNNLNKHSLGIELVNKGHLFGYQSYSKDQINSLIILCKYLKKKYSIKKDNFLGHSDIAPLRKIDPGEKFPWKLLAKKKISLWHSINKKKCKNLRNLKFQDKESFYELLFKFGYKYTNNSSEKIKIYKNFQRRFRPQLINSIIDRECYTILKSLI